MDTHTHTHTHLVSVILRMHSYGSITQHGLNTSGCHDDLLVHPDHTVGEVHEDTKLHLLLVAWHLHERPPRQLYLVHLITYTSSAKSPSDQ